MDTTIDRLMRADPDVIFELGARVEDWPRILPHYRWVRVLRADGDGRVVEMAARRPLLPVASGIGIPVRWTAIQRADPAEHLAARKVLAGSVHPTPDQAAADEFSLKQFEAADALAA